MKKFETKNHGNIHSIESLATLDGPGLRTVVFLQGCPLQCKFCHNIDCALKETKGTIYTPGALLQKILKNKPYWGSCNTDKKFCVKGGVTLSGGDPVFQPEFTLEVLKHLKANKIHTAIDTCLYTSSKIIDSWIPFVDLWMVSIKHMDDKIHRNLTTASNKKILENLTYLDTLISSRNFLNKPKIRIRFLIIPTITDIPEHINRVGEFVSKIKNLELLELLAYGSHGKHKWIEIFGKYDLESIPDATKDDLIKASKILEKFKFKIKF